jgi:uncharacterized repeat protein (TIGR02543 family)
MNPYTRKLVTKLLPPILLLSGLVVLPTVTSTQRALADGEVLTQVTEPGYSVGGRAPYSHYSLLAPTEGTWNLVGAWNFNNATRNATSPNYNSNCTGANNSDGNGGGPVANTWGSGDTALRFNALAGYGHGVSNMVLRKRVDDSGTSNENSGTDTGIRLSVSITGSKHGASSNTGGCFPVYELADYYGGQTNTQAPFRRSTRVEDGPTYIYPENYFVVSRSQNALWTNTFSNLDPNTKYRFQFVLASTQIYDEQITSTGSLNNGTPVSVTQRDTVDVSNAEGGYLSIRRNRITVTVSGYDTYTFTRDWLYRDDSGISKGSVLNAFTIYEEAKTATTTTQTVSNANPAVGDTVTLSASVSPTATGTVTFKDSSDNTLCTTSALSSSTASCSWTNNSAGVKTIRAIYSGSSTHSASTSSTADVTWISVFVTTYNATTNGGTAISPSTASFTEDDTALTLPTPVARTGFTANGWYTAASGGSKIGNAGASYTPTVTRTLYFQWTANSYTVTYDSNTGTGTMATQAITAGTQFELAVNAFEKSDFIFDGWYENSESTGTRYSAGGLVTLYASKTYYAKWSALPRAITYLANGATGTVPTQSAKNESETFIVAADTGLTRTGYSFAGWSDGTTTYAAGDTFTVAAANVTLTAQWTAQVYTVTYNGNNATSGSASRSSDSFTFGGSAIALPTAGTLVRTGYTFAGWSVIADGTAIAGNYTPTQSITLYAKWSADTYTISYNINGGSGSAPASSTYTTGGSTFALPDTTGFSKSGYDFGGWSTTTTGSALSGAQTSTSTKTLYAVWSVKSITATYAKGSASASTFTTFPTTATGNYGTTITLDSTVDTSVDIGGTTFVFQGWSDGTSIYQKGDTYLLGATDVTLTAQWVAIYGVRYTLNGGTAAAGDFSYDAQCTVGDNYCTNGQVITANATPTRAGYTFTGWKDQSNNSIAQAASFTVSAGTYLLYAQWTAISRAVTYELNGGSGSAPTESSKTISQSFSVASAPSRSGYTFTGWNDGTLAYGPGASYLVGNSAITLTAQWSTISYSITYDTNLGTSTTPTQSNLNIAGTFEVAAAPTRVGYTFVNWNNGAADFNPGATYTMGASNVVLTATWSATALTVTYALNGGTSTLPTTGTKTIGTTFALASAATYAGREFLGWNDGSTTYGAGVNYTIGSSNITLTAQWSGVLVSVTYLAGGADSGTVPTEVERESGRSFVIKAHTLNSLAKSGSTFAGWSDGSAIYQAAASYVPGNSPITLTATWSRDYLSVTYVAGGGTGTVPTQDDVARAGSFLIAAGTGLEKTSFTFGGWSDGSTTYAAGATYSNISTDLTLTAIWNAVSSGGGGIRYSEAPKVVDNPNAVQLTKNGISNKISWNNGKPATIIVTNFGGSKSLYENISNEFEVPNPKPGESKEITLVSVEDQSVVYDTKIIYQPPLPVQSLVIKQVASKTLTATWKPSSTVQGYKVIITPTVGAPIVIETKDPQFKVQTAPGQKYSFDVVAVGAGGLEAGALTKFASVSMGKVVTSLLEVSQPISMKSFKAGASNRLKTFAATLEPVSSVLCTGSTATKTGAKSALAAASRACAELQRANPEVFVKAISKVTPVRSNVKLKGNYVVDISIVIKPVT